MKIIIYLFLFFSWSFSCFAQQTTYEDYRKKADKCLIEKNYTCAIQNYERALRIRENDIYCTNGLKKATQLYKTANKPPTPPKNTSKSSPVSEKTPISDAYLLAQTDLPVNIIINGSSSITMSPKDLVKKIPLKIGENIVQVKPIDNGPGGFERTIKVNKSKNTILVINILAQRKTIQEPQKPIETTQNKTNTSLREVAQPEITEEKPKSEPWIDDINHQMVLVKGSTFQMGSKDQKPIHSVMLHDFYISKYEVTQRQWRMVMGKNPAQLADENCHDCPITQVSWEETQAFFQKLNQLSSLSYRLPTEAEWEYAARGGQKSNNFTYSSSNSIEDAGWYQKNSRRKIHPVGQKMPNELGLYDMTGNVWEWCQDWFSKNYYTQSPVNNPVNITPETYRVIRGGAADTNANSATTTHRDGFKPSVKSGFIGFRLAKD